MRRTLLVAGALTLCLGRRSFAQSGSVDEGAPFFIRPTGARSVGMALAVTAGATGGESIWWNPALVARSKREGSIHFRGKSHGADADGDITAFAVIPWANVGVLAFALRYLDYGTQDVTTGPTVPVGQIKNTNLILSATAATTFGRLATGVTLKQLRYLIPCTGDCTQNGESTSPNASALDVGMQYIVRRDSTISVAASITNMGPPVQVQDSPQADPLPARASFGVLYAPITPSWTDVRLRVAGDVVSRITNGTGLGFRLGAEVGYQERVYGRAGYMYLGPGEQSTPTVGFGLATAKLRIDFAQVMTASSSATLRPSFLSLRYVF